MGGLRNEHLKDKKDGKAAVQAKGTPDGAKRGDGKNLRKKPFGNSKPAGDPGREMRICRDFNEGKCTRSVCNFRHFCTQCGASSHGSASHPN